MVVSKLAKNTTVLFVFYIINSIVVFIQIKILSVWLGSNDMGLYLTVMAIGALLSIAVQFGMPMVVERFTAKYDALGLRDSMFKLILSSWVIVLLIGVSVVSGVWFFSDAITAMLYEVPPGKVIVFLASLIFTIASLKAVSYSAFNGLRRMEYPVIFECLYLTSFAALSYIYRDTLTVQFLLKLNLYLTVLFFLPAIFVLTVFVRKSDTKAKDNRKVLADVSSFWSGSFVNGFLSVLFIYADQLLISLITTYQSVAIFFVAAKVIYFCKRILSIPVVALSPEFTRKWELGEMKVLEKGFVRIVKLMFSIGVFAAIILSLLSKKIVLIVSDRDFVNAAEIIIILCLSLPLMAIYSPMSAFFRAIDKIRLMVISNVLWIGIYLIVGAVMLKTTGSLVLLAVSQLVASITTLSYNLFMIREWFSLKNELHNFIKITICGFFVAVTGSVVIRYGFTSDVGEVVVISVVTLVLFSVLLILSHAFSIEDRREIISVITNRWVRDIAQFLLFPERLFGAVRR